MVVYLGLLILHRGSGGGLGLLTLHRGSGGLFRTIYLT